MSVYRDAGHCIARVMSIETNTCTAQSAWQKAYQSGFSEAVPAGCGLTAEERLTQDAMTRSMLMRELPREQWHAMVAKYSVNNHEVADSVRWLVSSIKTPAHHLFKMKAVSAWAIPCRLPKQFYELHSWDNAGTPDSTLRRWRGDIRRQLGGLVDDGHHTVAALLSEYRLLDSQ